MYEQKDGPYNCSNIVIKIDRNAASRDYIKKIGEFLKEKTAENGWNLARFTGSYEISEWEIPDELSIEDGMKWYEKLKYSSDKFCVPNWDLFDELCSKIMDAVINGLLKKKSIKKLGKEWFRNYGEKNGWGYKQWFMYKIASKLHDIAKKKYPDEHIPMKNDKRGIRVDDHCSCGFYSQVY